MATIRWGIIGCGDVTEVKSGPALYKTCDSALVAVMRRSADKARDYAVRHGVPRWYDQAEDAVTASFAFKSSALGAGVWNFASDQPCDRIEIVGDKGRIAFSTFAFTPVELITNAGTQTFAIDPPQHVQQPLIQTVVNALLGRGECPSTGESAARTSRVMDQIVRDHAA